MFWDIILDFILNTGLSNTHALFFFYYSGFPLEIRCVYEILTLGDRLLDSDIIWVPVYLGTLWLEFASVLFL